jgi:DNA-3-methyladenine glycosylase
VSDRARLSGPAREVAPSLLGARLQRGQVAVELTEVEAYEGEADPASHAFRGKTARNAVMFGPAGHLYVYFVYGMHWCANVTCGADGQAAAVLLRAGRVVAGEDEVRARRPHARSWAELARGPARLAECLGLTGADTGLDLLARTAPVRLRLGPMASDVDVGPRVGVAAAHDELLRFWLVGDPTVSSYRRGGRKAVATRRHT